MANVQNKVVLITGASSGIGEATARLLAEHGAKVVLGARRTDRLEQIASEISAAGGSAVFKTLDVTSQDDFASFVEFAQEKFGQVDVLFNNAGVMPLSRLNALKVDEWNSMIDINIRGVLNGIAAVLPIMGEQNRGHIINTASIAAHIVGPTSAVYSATKFAVWAIGEGLRQESPNLRVTTISPGVVSTELGLHITDQESRQFLTELRKTAIDSIDIARSVLYAIEQPDNVEVNEIIVRPIAQMF